MNEEQKMVLDYHRKMGFTINGCPTVIGPIQVKDRSDILQEEVDELRTALENGNLGEIADGIGDAIYVLIGTAVACGIDIKPIFKEIHRSNMTKTPPLSETGKAIKGEGYSPPKLESILSSQMYLDEPCPKCEGSGKLQDPVHDWVVIDCFICKGKGLKPQNFDKLYG